MGRDTVPGFAEILRQLREERDLSIDALAELAHTHRDSIAKLERGERAPSFRLACDLADALGVTVDGLRGTGTKAKVAPARGRLTGKKPAVNQAKSKRSK